MLRVYFRPYIDYVDCGVGQPFVADEINMYVVLPKNIDGYSAVYCFAIRYCILMIHHVYFHCGLYSYHTNAASVIQLPLFME